MILRQSTSQVVRFGPFVDATDGDTAEGNLTIGRADMQLSKDGAAFAQKNTSGDATHDTDGYYSTTLDTTDTATVGELILQVKVAGALPVRMRWYTVEEAIYDAFYAASATGLLPANVTQLSGVAQSLTDLKTFADDGYDPSTNKVQGVVLVDTTTTNTDMVAAAPSAIANRQEMDSNSTQLSLIVADTNELQVDNVPGLISALNDFDPTADAVANVTLVATTTTNTDMVAAAPTAASNADAVWAEVLSDHYESGTTMTKAATFMKNILAMLGWWKKISDTGDSTILTKDTDATTTIRTQTESVSGDENTYAGS